MTKEAEKILKDIRSELCMLSSSCITEISNRQLSAKSKLPYKLSAFLYSLCWRIKESSEAALQLISAGFVQPSLMQIRSSIEIASMAFHLRAVVEDVVNIDSLPTETDSEPMKLLFANRYEPEEQSEYDSEFRARKISFYNDKLEQQYPGIKRYYHLLSEFVHVNSDGTLQSYSELDIENDKTTFGPVLNENHGLFPAFVITLQLTLTIFNEQTQFIFTHLGEFVKVCEKDIDSRTFDESNRN